MEAERLNRVAGRRIVEIDAHADQHWDDFVATHPQALPYHHLAYLRLLERAYGYRPKALACEDGEGRIVGVLPLTETDRLLTGRGFTSLPRTLTAGPLGDDENVAAALLDAAIDRTGRKENGRLQIRTYVPDLQHQSERLLGGPHGVGYVLELPEHPAELRFGNSRNHGAIKRAVNKAARSGVCVREAETEAELREWYTLYLDTMRWHVALPRPYRFFKACWEILRPAGLMRLLLAEREEGGQRRLLAGSIFLMYGHTVCFYVNGRRKDALDLRPNDAIHWRAIHDAYAQGYRWYDLGGLMEENEGLARFKSKWGAEARTIYYYYFPGPGRLAALVDGPKSPARRLAEAVWAGFPRTAWRRLPLPVTVVLGNLVYTYF